MYFADVYVVTTEYVIGIRRLEMCDSQRRDNEIDIKYLPTITEYGDIGVVN